MNKKYKEFSDRYNAEKIVQANKDTLIYWLEKKGKWLQNIFIDRNEGEYDKFINEMAFEIEGYQRWMYLKGIKEGTVNRYKKVKAEGEE